MCTVNQKKLFKGLEGEGIAVTIRSLAKFMACAGVLVTPHVGRLRGYIAMPGAVYGVKPEKMTESGSTFYSERVSQGHLSFIPREDEAALAVLEKRLRRAVELYSVSDGFIPMKGYERLKDDFEGIRQAYFNKRDEIVSRWDRLLDDFEFGAKEMLDGLNLPESMREQVLKEFMAEVPSRKEYANSFSMTLRVHAFPAEVSQELQGLQTSIASDVLDTWKEDVVSTAILSIEKQIGIGWEKMLAAMRQYVKGGNINVKTIGVLVRYADEMSWKNVFNNVSIKELSKSLGELQKTTNADEQAEIIEDALASLYAYTKDVGIDLDWSKSPYKPSQLEALLKARGNVNTQKLTTAATAA